MERRIYFLITPGGQRVKMFRLVVKEKFTLKNMAVSQNELKQPNSKIIKCYHNLALRCDNQNS